MRRKEAQNERILAEKDTQRIYVQKEELELEFKTLEESKVSAKQSVESLQLEVVSLNQEMDDNIKEMFRWEKTFMMHFLDIFTD